MKSRRNNAEDYHLQQFNHQETTEDGDSPGQHHPRKYLARLNGHSTNLAKKQWKTL
jgi:hypothetical protein